MPPPCPPRRQNRPTRPIPPSPPSPPNPPNPPPAAAGTVERAGVTAGPAATHHLGYRCRRRARLGATIGSGDTSHGHPLMLLMGNARPPTVGPQGALGQRSDYSACVWCWALPMLRDNAAAGDGGWRRGQRTGPTAWFDRLPRLTLRVAFVVTSVCAPGSMSSSLGSSTKYEYDMTTDSGTPLSEFLATSWTWAEQTQKHPISARNGG